MFYMFICFRKLKHIDMKGIIILIYNKNGLKDNKFGFIYNKNGLKDNKFGYLSMTKMV